MSSRIRAVLRVLVIGAIAISWLTALVPMAIAPRGPAGNDVDRAVAGYLRVGSLVPKDQVVGFVSFAPDEPTVTMQLFVAQSAMAPRVLQRTLDQAAYVVTMPNAPEQADSDPRLKAFELFSRAPAGIRVYRRRP